MNKLMWSETKGLFFDYDYLNDKRGSVESLASFVPLFTKMASKEQAHVLSKKLNHFMFSGGLAHVGQADDAAFEAHDFSGEE